MSDVVTRSHQRGEETWKAIYSPCERYRYSLERIWEPGGSLAQFVGLNPSTATELANDPTVKRCIDYAKSWGCGGMIMSNIFAWRDTDPKNMKAADEPIGEDNNYYLQKDRNRSSVTVFAWGNHGEYHGRCYDVALLLEPGHCLKITKAGHPNHPLYLQKALKPIQFPGYKQ